MRGAELGGHEGLPYRCLWNINAIYQVDVIYIMIVTMYVYGTSCDEWNWKVPF